jgi:hypothetical protein
VDHLLMDQDDPENRIAELEPQLAEQKHMAEPEHLEERPVVTPEDVHNVAPSLIRVAVAIHSCPSISQCKMSGGGV